MAEKTNPTLVGLFVLGAIILAAFTLIIFGSSSFFSAKRNFVLYFEGSVKGLSVGAPVTFRGVKVGEVTDIAVDIDPHSKKIEIPVIISIEPNHIRRARTVERLTEMDIDQMIKAGLRAQLTPQSLVTGQLMIEFGFFPNTPIRLIGRNEKYKEIPTIPSDLEAILKKIEKVPLDEIITKVNDILDATHKLVNSQELKNTLTNLAEMSVHLNNLASQAERKITPIADGANEVLNDVQQLVSNLSIEVDKVSTDLKAVVKSAHRFVNHLDKQLPTIASQFDTTTKLAQQSIKQIERTFATLNNTISPHSPIMDKINTALENLSSAARALRILSEYIEEHPEALLRGKTR